MTDFDRQLIQSLLASNKAEALTWLRAATPQSFRNIGEMDTTEESIRFIQHLYDLGATTVLAVEIDEYPDGQNTGNLLVELPNDSDARARLFSFERDHAESHGFDATPDTDQPYLYLKLD